MKRIVYSKFEADHVFLLKNFKTTKKRCLLNKLLVIKKSNISFLEKFIHA